MIEVKQLDSWVRGTFAIIVLELVVKKYQDGG